MDTNKPNVLLITDDQHNARCLGCYGNDDVRTPTLDGLAADGTRFERAYAQSPICLPSRTSFMTGRYPHSLGVYGNRGRFDEGVVSMAHQFRTHGYDTAAFGKLHLPYGWPTEGFETRRTCDFADAEQFAEENDYYRYLQRVGYADEYDLGLGSNEFPGLAFVSNIPFEHSVEKWTADEAIRWLDERDGDAPFFSWLTFQRPHGPYCPPPEFADMYDPDDIELPPHSRDVSDRPEEWENRATDEFYGVATDDDIRQVLAYYYTLITIIDRQIGRVLDHLDVQGELDDTIVVFHADHGDFAGEHGLMQKNVCVPEAIHRVPLVFRYPEGVRAGQAVDDLVELVDLFPTLCGLSDVTTPEQTQGRDLGPTLVQGDPVGREAAVCLTPDYRTIRTDRWKLTHCVGRETGELYDVEDDPWEQTNLYHDEEYIGVRADLLGQLVDFHLETEEPTITTSGQPSDTEASRAHKRRWWETGGNRNPSPLAHFGGPGYPLDDDASDSN